VNVLCLLPDFVLPQASGLRVRALSQLRILAAIEQVESITLLSFSETPVPPERVRELATLVPKLRVEPPIVRETHVRREPRALLRFLRHRVLGGKPYLIAINDVGTMHRRVVHELASGRYAAVYVGYLGMMAYAEDVRRVSARSRVVLEQHNLEWQIFDRLAGQLETPMRQLVAHEAGVLRRFEQRAMREVDSVIAISATDAAEFRTLAGVDATVIPPFIKPQPPRRETQAEPSLGYIGHLAWQPNTQGLDWFCERVWPLVRARVPNARLTIAGPGLGKDAAGALLAPPRWQQPGITTIGFVDDLETLYRDVTAMIAPVVGGSGVRMKLLETLSAGMPTVTTTHGAMGLLVENGRELMIADEPADFADATARLIGDAALRERLRHAGYAYLETHHSEASAKVRLERALKLAPAPAARNAIRADPPV
jgi:glycosyltransferase involved in cell wall biosynthesis